MVNIPDCYALRWSEDIAEFELDIFEAKELMRSDLHDEFQINGGVETIRSDPGKNPNWFETTFSDRSKLEMTDLEMRIIVP